MGKGSSPLQNQGLGCFAGGLSVPPALLRVCFRSLFQTDIEKEKKTKLPSVLEDSD